MRIPYICVPELLLLTAGRIPVFHWPSLPLFCRSDWFSIKATLISRKAANLRSRSNLRLSIPTELAIAVLIIGAFRMLASAVNQAVWRHCCALHLAITPQTR